MGTKNFKLSTYTAEIPLEKYYQCYIVLKKKKLNYKNPTKIVGVSLH